MTTLEIVLTIICCVFGIGAAALFILLKVLAKGASDVGSGFVKAFMR